MEFCRDQNPELYDKLKDHCKEGKLDALLEDTQSNAMAECLQMFVGHRSEQNKNFALWWSYLEMVQVLLMYTKGQREGIFKLHMYSFKRMLPFMFRYSH